MAAYKKLSKINTEIENIVNDEHKNLSIINKEKLLDLKNKAVELGCKGSQEKALMYNINNLVTSAINRWQKQIDEFNSSDLSKPYKSKKEETTSRDLSKPKLRFFSLEKVPNEIKPSKSRDLKKVPSEIKLSIDLKKILLETKSSYEFLEVLEKIKPFKPNELKNIFEDKDLSCHLSATLKTNALMILAKLKTEDKDLSCDLLAKLKTKNIHSSSYSSNYSLRLNDRNKSDGAMLGGR